MATEFQQTDASALCALDAYCSGNSDNADEESNRAEDGGTAGTTARTIDADLSAADLNAIWMEIFNIDSYDGASGNWTVRLDVTSSNHQIVVDEIHICRLNSSCVNQETLGSLLTIGRNLGSNQVESFTVNQSANTTITAGDRILVIFAIDNLQNMAQAVAYTPSQNITGPGALGGGPQTVTTAVAIVALVAPAAKLIFDQIANFGTTTTAMPLVAPASQVNQTVITDTVAVPLTAPAPAKLVFDQSPDAAVATLPVVAPALATIEQTQQAAVAVASLVAPAVAQINQTANTDVAIAPLIAVVATIVFDQIISAAVAPIPLASVGPQVNQTQSAAVAIVAVRAVAPADVTITIVARPDVATLPFVAPSPTLLFDQSPDVGVAVLPFVAVAANVQVDQTVAVGVAILAMSAPSPTVAFDQFVGLAVAIMPLVSVSADVNQSITTGVTVVPLVAPAVVQVNQSVISAVAVVPIAAPAATVIIDQTVSLATATIPFLALAAQVNQLITTGVVPIPFTAPTATLVFDQSPDVGVGRISLRAIGPAGITIATTIIAGPAVLPLEAIGPTIVVGAVTVTTAACVTSMVAPSPSVSQATIARTEVAGFPLVAVAVAAANAVKVDLKSPLLTTEATATSVTLATATSVELT